MNVVYVYVIGSHLTDGIVLEEFNKNNNNEQYYFCYC